MRPPHNPPRSLHPQAAKRAAARRAEYMTAMLAAYFTAMCGEGSGEGPMPRTLLAEWSAWSDGVAWSRSGRDAAALDACNGAGVEAGDAPRGLTSTQRVTGVGNSTNMTRHRSTRSHS